MLIGMPFFKSKFMGLDISVYSKINFESYLTEPEEYPEEDDQEGQEKYDNWEDKSIHLTAMDYFKLQNEGIKSGGYDFSGESDSFRAGSYSGYGYWRRQLASMVGLVAERVWDKPEEYKNEPFFELINFSDCESFIGPKTSAKLYQDFLKFDEKAAEFSRSEGAIPSIHSFKEKYDTWKNAFRIASDGGAVVFS